MNNEEHGFTLIELLVVISILGILAGLTVECSVILRTRSYNNISVTALHDARVALMAGSDDLQEEPAGWYGGWLNSPGEMIAWTGHHILPGYNNPDGVEILAFRNTWCDIDHTGWCIAEGVFTHHCKTDRRISWMRWQNGVETTTVWPAVPNCH